MRSVIGIITDIDNEKSIKMPDLYAQCTERAGGLPIVLPYIEDKAVLSEYAELCDGFLFSGGADVSPAYYGEPTKEYCGETEKFRDELEFALFRYVFAAKKPILGICRGSQFINVALGGSLYQDIDIEAPSDVVHRLPEAKFDCYHDVKVLEGTPLAVLVKKDTLRVNSIHHQAIKALGKGLIPTALAPDGIIEAISYTGEQYLRAYQWHPERLCAENEGEDNRKIFEDFIGACKKEA